MPLLTINGAQLHYELAGRGCRTLAFVHGGCCAASDWDAQVAELAPEYAVLAMDLRGHGMSAGTDGALTVAQWAADVNALIDALEINSAVIVGHSLGARIAADAVWRRPGRYAGLVLIDGSRTIGGLSATEPQSGAENLQTMGGTIEQILDRTVGPHADDAVRAKVIRTMSSAPEAVMSACVVALEEWDRDRANEVYAALDLPALAIQSTYHDRFTPRRSFADGARTSPYLDSLRAAMPQLVVEIVPDTGHFSMIERPQEVTALIRAFGTAITE